MIRMRRNAEMLGCWNKDKCWDKKRCWNAGMNK
jgi:hypothetical protein